MCCYLHIRTQSAPSLTDHVREALLAELLSGRLESGDGLPVAALAARFEVSGAVVREALTGLAAEGLLDPNPKSASGWSTFRSITFAI
jgi:DNA-binding GntR family transcriptional regulator